MTRSIAIRKVALSEPFTVREAKRTSLLIGFLLRTPSLRDRPFSSGLIDVLFPMLQHRAIDQAHLNKTHRQFR